MLFNQNILLCLKKFDGWERGYTLSTNVSGSDVRMVMGIQEGVRFSWDNVPKPELVFLKASTHISVLVKHYTMVVIF